MNCCLFRDNQLITQRGRKSAFDIRGECCSLNSCALTHTSHCRNTAVLTGDLYVSFFWICMNCEDIKINTHALLFNINTLNLFDYRLSD